LDVSLVAFSFAFNGFVLRLCFIYVSFSLIFILIPCFSFRFLAVIFVFLFAVLFFIFIFVAESYLNEYDDRLNFVYKYLILIIIIYKTMKTLCSMALKTVLLCACFSSVLFACEDGETVEPTEKKPLVFNEPYFEKLSKPLSEDLIYSKGVSLKRNAVIQSMDIAKNGDIYYVQIAGSSQHQLNVLHGAPNATNPSECMVFEFFGHGTNMAVEEAADGTYIWLGSHGNKGSDKSYGGWRGQSGRRGVPMPGDGELMRLLRLNNPYALADLKEAAAAWDNRRVFAVLGLLREYDAKSKGLGAGGATDGELLRELLLKIFTP